MGKKTSERHFELFREHVGIYADALGLHDWEIYLFHSKLDGAFACMATNGYMKDRCASITLTTEWSDKSELNDSEIIKSAKHEVLELVVDDICSIASARFINEDELALARHTLVRRLEKVL